MRDVERNEVREVRHARGHLDELRDVPVHIDLRTPCKKYQPHTIAKNAIPTKVVSDRP